MTKGRYSNNGKIKNNAIEDKEPEKEGLETIIRQSRSTKNPNSNNYGSSADAAKDNPIKNYGIAGANKPYVKKSADYLVDFPNSNYAGEKIYLSELKALSDINVPIKDYRKDYDSSASGKQAIVTLENGHVKCLNIDEYSIGTFPASLENIIFLTELISLSIGEEEGKNVKFSLPSNIRNLKKLKNLTINFADFSYIPYTLNELNDLQVVSFSHTNVKDITALYSIQSLRCIDLSKSKVGYIDSAIIKLNNLELLDITGLKFDSSSRVVIEYLKKKGVNVIE